MNHKKAPGLQLFILPSAKKRLDGLPTFEKNQISSRISQLAANGFAPNDGLKNKIAPQYKRVLHANYFIDYVIDGGEVTVEGISLDPHSSANENEQQKALYRVDKMQDVAVSQNMSSAAQEDMKAAWKLGDKSDGFVRTKHAAVNGMLNDLVKAAWLMGTHVQVGFPDDSPGEYTLFHNPTRGFLSDIWDCVNDKFGVSTAEAKHLADVLHDNQKNGQPVKWVVHSQGGLIFAEAVRYHLKNRSGSLSMNSVVFHGNANNRWRTDKLLNKAGIERLAPDRANDYDFVHQALGMNGNPAQVIGSAIHIRRLGGDENDQTWSTHTLPLVGQETWNRKNAILKGKSSKFAHPFK